MEQKYHARELIKGQSLEEMCPYAQNLCQVPMNLKDIFRRCLREHEFCPEYVRLNDITEKIRIKMIEGGR